MKKNKRVFRIIFAFSLVLFLVSYHQVAYAATYGTGTYGSGAYGAASTPTPGSGSSSNPSSSNNSGSSQTCSSQAPSSAPNLFQINTINNQATLYFAPAGKPYDSYYVSFGNNKNDEGYGASFSQGQTSGVISYTVYQLKPNTTYTFKVRAGNGCAPGAWSKDLTAKTTGSKNIVKKYYSSLISHIVSTVKNIVGKLPIVNKFIQTEPTIIQQQATTPTPTQKPTTNIIQSTQQTEQVFTPTAVAKKKTCFFFICW